MSKALRYSAFLFVLIAPGVCFADGIGDYTGTSTPQVITPGVVAAPQTPAYPPPPIGSDIGPAVSSYSHYREVAPPPRPHG
jgi:hypothetical protein